MGFQGSACRERASTPAESTEHTHFSCCIDRAKSVKRSSGWRHGLKSTYCKVSLEGFGAPVVVVATDLTVVVDVQPVELIEPVWDRLEEIEQSV